MKDVCLVAAVLVLLTAALAYRISRAGEFSFTEDESHHAVTGVYFADFLRDLPLAHPVEYTYRYYARYPALGLVHWPPFFHFCEGILFRVAGPSTTAARVTVVLFALLGVTFWFLLMRELLNSAAAMFSALALAFLPAVLVYEQAVMLEVPSLSMCIVASYFWLRVLRDGSRRAFVIFAILVLLAVFTKQQCAYLLPFALLTAWTEKKWSVLLNGSNLLVVGISAVILAVFAVVTVKVHLPSVVDHLLVRHYRIEQTLFYLRRLPEQFGWPMLLLSMMGIVTSLWWSSRNNTRFMLLWILTMFASIAFVAARSERYVMYWIPPFLYFASWPFAVKLKQAWMRIGLGSVAAVVLVASAWQAWQGPYPYLAGFSDTAEALARTDPQGGIVLYDGFWDGNFIFQMRRVDSQRRFVILTKGLYATRITARFAAEELAHDDAEIQKVLAAYGIRYLAITEQTEYEFPIQQKLRELVRTPQFRLVRTIPVRCEVQPQVTAVLIYENLFATRPTATSLHLRMLTLTHDIEVPLKDLGIE